MCKRLVEGGIGINFVDEEDFIHDALSVAAECGRLEIIKVLVEAGAEKYLPYPESSILATSGPLAAAITFDNSAIVKYLVQEAKFDMSIRFVGMDGAAYTGLDQALLLASTRTDCESLKILIEAGADVNTIIRDNILRKPGGLPFQKRHPLATSKVSNTSFVRPKPTSICQSPVVNMATLLKPAPVSTSPKS